MTKRLLRLGVATVALPAAPSPAAADIMWIGGQAFRTVSVDGDSANGRIYRPINLVKIRANAQAGTPIVFFPGAREIGIEGAAGLALRFGK